MKLNPLAEQYYKEMVGLCGSKYKAAYYGYTMKVVVDSGEHEVDRVLEIDIIRDYEMGFVDSIVVKAQVMKSTYNDVLYPARNNFSVKLIATQTTEKENGTQLMDPDIIEREYKGVLSNPRDLTQDSASAQTPFNNGSTGGDKIPIDVTFQLMPFHVEDIYKSSYGGIFTGEPWMVLRSMLTEVMTLVTKNKPDGVDIIESDMKDKTVEMVIPHGTRAVDLPRYIQDNWHGIYTQGIGSYLHDNHWYIYPLYRTGRWEKEKYKVTISIIPPAYMPDSKRSYHVHWGEVNIICAADTGQFDNITATTYNQGDGVTAFDTQVLHGESVKWEDGKVYIDGTKSRKEIIKNPREDGKNYLPVAKEMLVNSDHHLKSAVIGRQGIIVKCTWENSNAFLLRPGMPCRIVYWKKDVKYEIEGTILKEVSTIGLSHGMALKRHSSSTGFGIYCDPSTVKMIESKTTDTTGVSHSLLDGLKSFMK